MGASSNMSLLGTQQERRQQLIHCNAGNKATKNVTQDAHFKMVHNTGSSKNTMQHATGCEYSHPIVNSYQLTV